jgi:aldehyde:ferredoxin oxidoreductase
MYTSRILWVNLADETTSITTVDGETMRKYLGGPGLAAKMIWDETSAATDPLSSENPLMFITGPLTGTRVPGSGHYSVAAVSPLTGIWGEAHSGGTWGYALRHTPYMGIGFRGRATSPVYLWIDGEQAKILDATHLWGKDTFETDELIRKETHQRASVAAIGQAGERLVRIAAIMTDGRAARAAARSGLGAVMGSKNLKAVVVRGTARPRVYDEQGLQKSVRENSPQTFLDVERAVGASINQMGPIKNWTRGEFEGFDEKLREARSSGEPYHCAGCPVGCWARMRHGERNLHGEHAGPMGSNLLIDNFDAIYEAFSICNRYGLDCISAGGVIGFAMELYDKGLITDRDTEGISLRWGNHEAMIEMLRKIGERKGFGELLGEGVRRAAERIGEGAREYAMHVKGLEPSMHDPRYQNATAIIDATANRGADHLDGLVARSHYNRGYATPYLEDEEAREASLNLFAVAGTGKFAAWCQDFSNVLNAIGVCIWMAQDRSRRLPTKPFGGVQPPQFAEWLNCVTGWNMDLDELMKAGERLFNLKRVFNVRRGISRKDDVLPMRFCTLKRGGKSIAANNLPHLGAMLNEYYLHRGWSEEGIPSREKLSELELEELVVAIHR